MTSATPNRYFTLIYLLLSVSKLNAKALEFLFFHSLLNVQEAQDLIMTAEQVKTSSRRMENSSENDKNSFNAVDSLEVFDDLISSCSRFIDDACLSYGYSSGSSSSRSHGCSSSSNSGSTSSGGCISSGGNGCSSTGNGRSNSSSNGCGSSSSSSDSVDDAISSSDVCEGNSRSSSNGSSCFSGANADGSGVGASGVDEKFASKPGGLLWLWG
ncbi:hypothetical protein HELRODRAFT_168739 [Helobdella robusta]|uniref:Uncharacterized protein n=1 Tax=Helobdella robusta TaxID=6412 RepID=T1F0W6_HELRO|nr:hypothetical protein HELRODRAFT_168739 [Helobdella robusta]ESO08828.1 hypothetical protein HELRODRAFT_168739 [Helobdella robusta]